MSDYLYYCVKCNSLAADTYENDEVVCNKCGAAMTPLHVNEDEWNSMSKEEMRELILRYRAPVPKVQKAQRKRPVSPPSQEYYDKEDISERKPKKQKPQKPQRHHSVQREDFEEPINSFKIPIIGKICLIAAAVFVVGMIIFGIVRVVKNNSDDSSEAVASENMDTSNEENGTSGQLNSTDDIENWDDSMKYTGDEAFNNEEEILAPVYQGPTEVVLSDGPIVLEVRERGTYGDMTGFALMQYSLKTGEKYELFDFNISNFSLAKDLLGDDPSFCKKEIFDSGLSRIAVSWNEKSDGSHHTGWIDRNGNLTDVTSIVHPSTNAFSSIAPIDGISYFTSKDLFGFFDQNNRVFCYYDDNTKQIIDTYTPNGEPLESDYDFNAWVNHIIGLDDNDIPTNSTMYNNGTYSYSVGEYGGIVQDCVKYDDGYVFIMSSGSEIKAFGPGVTELSPGYRSEAHYWGYDAVPITPQSDYRIEKLAYCNGNIIFTAKKGSERALFKMSYVNRTPGEPELITTIDDTWGMILFWSDKDITVPVIIPDVAATSTTPAKEYQFIDGFEIEGTWHNIGEGTFGQIDKDSAVVFDGGHCNVYSPSDTYAFYPEDDHYILQCTGLLGGDHTFSVYIVDKKHIDLIKGNNIIELEKVK